MSEGPENLRFEKHISNDVAGKTVLECLYEHTDLSKQQLKKTMQNGAVWLESCHGVSRVRRARKTLNRNDKLHLYYDEGIQQTKPEAAKLIADEGGYSIWDKPGGMFSQGSKWGDHCTIYRWAEQHLEPQRPAFLVHRLDRAANGLIILAHSRTLAATFSAMFREHLLTKKYRAVVNGCLEPEKLPWIIDAPLDDKQAITQITSLHPDAQHRTTTVEIEIKTGRKHQIRRHLAGIGHPISGDRLYGDASDTTDLQLSAIALGFRCPLSHTEKKYSL